VLDESFLLLFNGHHEDHEFTLPEPAFGQAWTLVLNTADDDAEAIDIAAGESFDLVHHSLVLLRRVSE
jgi:glycogen operon protein